MTTTVRWLSGSAIVLVLLQAVLVGQGLFLRRSIEDRTPRLDRQRDLCRGDRARRSRQSSAFVAASCNRSALGLGVLIALLTVAQIGLGVLRAWW